jgi:hypothetical protein
MARAFLMRNYLKQKKSEMAFEKQVDTTPPAFMGHAVGDEEDEADEDDDDEEEAAEAAEHAGRGGSEAVARAMDDED